MEVLRGEKWDRALDCRCTEQSTPSTNDMRDSPHAQHALFMKDFRTAAKLIVYQRLAPKILPTTALYLLLIGRLLAVRKCTQTETEGSELGVRKQKHNMGESRWEGKQVDGRLLSVWSLRKD